MLDDHVRVDDAHRRRSPYGDGVAVPTDRRPTPEPAPRAVRPTVVACAARTGFTECFRMIGGSADSPFGMVPPAPTAVSAARVHPLGAPNDKTAHGLGSVDGSVRAPVAQEPPGSPRTDSPPDSSAAKDVTRVSSSRVKGKSSRAPQWSPLPRGSGMGGMPATSSVGAATPRGPAYVHVEVGGKKILSLAQLEEPPQVRGDAFVVASSQAGAGEAVRAARGTVARTGPHCRRSGRDSRPRCK